MFALRQSGPYNPPPLGSLWAAPIVAPEFSQGLLKGLAFRV